MWLWRMVGRLASWGRAAALPDLVCVMAQPDSWCAQYLSAYPLDYSKAARFDALAARIHATDALGPKPLWQGYRAGPDASRRAGQVSKCRAEGAFFAWLVERSGAQTILEFGTAFGASGSYWLAGIEANGSGHLLTFEPNVIWAQIAVRNLAAVSSRFTLTQDMFENHVARLQAAGTQVDIAFIDAIHTRAFVESQLALVRTIAAPGALILLDDIDFSEDMAACWQALSQSGQFAAVYRLGARLGVLELPR